MRPGLLLLAPPPSLPPLFMLIVQFRNIYLEGGYSGSDAINQACFTKHPEKL